MSVKPFQLVSNRGIRAAVTALADLVTRHTRAIGEIARAYASLHNRIVALEQRAGIEPATPPPPPVD